MLSSHHSADNNHGQLLLDLADLPERIENKSYHTFKIDSRESTPPCYNPDLLINGVEHWKRQRDLYFQECRHFRNRKQLEDYRRSITVSDYWKTEALQLRTKLEDHLCGEQDVSTVETCRRSISSASYWRTEAKHYEALYWTQERQLLRAASKPGRGQRLRNSQSSNAKATAGVSKSGQRLATRSHTKMNSDCISSRLRSTKQLRQKR